jgi:alpha-beta hydrolase superfamily lysophospholipase
MYRQVTLAGLTAGFADNSSNQSIAYDSLLSGWESFLADYSDGRPFILIGHSQGAAMVIRLVESQIDHNAALRARLVSAIILGGNVQVPTGKLVGGSFANIPACTAATETGCVIAYSTYPSEPPATSIFGRPGKGVSLQSDQTASSQVNRCSARTRPTSAGGRQISAPSSRRRNRSVRSVSRRHGSPIQAFTARAANTVGERPGCR